jgi:hypothetical protein
MAATNEIFRTTKNANYSIDFPSRARRCHELVFKGHDVVLELNDNNLEGKNKIFIGTSLVSRGWIK